jgi:hypothetical protein
MQQERELIDHAIDLRLHHVGATVTGVAFDA